MEKAERQGYFDEAVEAMPPEQREKYLNQRLRKIVEYAYQNAPTIKQKFDQAGISPSQIRTVKDLERIPVTTKDELRELQKVNPPFGGFFTGGMEKLERIYISPGPIYEPAEAQSLQEAKMLAKAYSALGITKGDRIVNTFTYHMVPAGLLIDQGLRQLGATVIPTGVGNSELQLQIMRDLKVTGYVGTPSFLMTLIKRAEGLGYDFRKDFELRLAMFTAEPLPPSLRRIFEDDYGIQTAQIYGTADVRLIGYECSQKSGLHIPEEIIVEIVNPGTGKQLGPGEVGEVVATSFNEVYPLIRFGTGDLSYYTDEPCPCGRTSPRLVRIVGRVGEIVKVRGMFIHPKEAEAAVSKFSEVSKFQIVVNRAGERDQMSVKVELVDEGVNKERLKEALQESIKGTCRLKADIVEFVAKGTIPEEHKIILDERVWE